MQSLLSQLLLSLIVLLCISCGSSQTPDSGPGPSGIELLIRVHELPADVTSLRVSASLNGKSALSDTTWTEQLDRFGVRLPLAASSDGTLELTVHALSSDGCKVAVGRLSSAVSTATPYSEADVHLELLPNKLCPVTVAKTGAGTVSSDPPGIACGATCQAEFPIGSTVNLTAQQTGNQFRTEWGTSCAAQYGASATCGLTVTGPTTVRVRLREDYCPPGAWCPFDWNLLSATWGADANNIWAVGSGGIILKWDGSAWALQPSGTEQDLSAVWGTASDSVFAVGRGGTVLRWNGTAWSAVKSGTTQDLFALHGTSASDLWVVGAGGTVLRWNGTAFAQPPSGTKQDLLGAWVSAGGVWLVGRGGTVLTSLTGGDGSLAPRPSGTTQDLYAVWGTAAASGPRVFIAGDGGTLLDGSAGSITAAPSGTTASLRGIWGSDPSSVWAVGNGGTLLRWNGTAWAAQSTGVSKHLRGVWGTASGVLYVAGQGGTLLKQSGGSFTPQATGLTPFLRSVSGSGTSSAWAVGDGGVILKWNGSTWSPQSSGTSVILHGVFTLDPANIWAVGESGTILRSDGSQWSRQTSNTTEILRGVWGTSASNVYTVSTATSILRWNGTAWASVFKGTNASASFYGISGSDANNIWVVGWTSWKKWDGVSWTGPGALAPLINNVWALDPANVWAVNTLGGIGRFTSGNSWDFSGFSTGVDMRGLWGTDASNIWACGKSGTIVKWSGSAWNAQTSGTSSNLWSVWGSSSRDVWAVGEDGTILRYVAP